MPTPDANEATMSFGDHLDELRRRMLLGLAVPIPLFIVVFFLSDTLIRWLLLPVYVVLRQHDLPQDLQVLSPPEFLLTKLKLSVIGALVLSGPWLLWQMWMFIAPGLYRHERRFVRFLMPGSAVLTVAGVLLLYYVMLPLMLHVLVLFAANLRVEAGPAPDPRITKLLAGSPAIAVRTAPPVNPAPGETWLLWPSQDLYTALPAEGAGVEILRVPPPAGGRIDQRFRVSFVVDFTLVLLLGIVIAFQTPLVIVLLGWLNLATPRWLAQQRAYALLVCAVVSAVITPADALSMILMLAPLYALYELGIFLLKVAPASAVAEGGALRFGRRPRAPADNRGSEEATQPFKVVQSEASQPRSPAPADSPPPPADGDDDT